MGWDFIEYHGEHEQFRDSDLWLLRDFFIRAAESLAAAGPPTGVIELRAFFDRWEWCGPGVVTGTDFTEFVSGDRSRWELLFRAMQSAGDTIAEFGESLPLSYIHPIGIAGGCHYTLPFEHLRHRSIVRHLGLPEWAIASGFDYIHRGETPPGLEREELRHSRRE